MKVFLKYAYWKVKISRLEASLILPIGILNWKEICKTLVYVF